jgi:hypothetical protein
MVVLGFVELAHNLFWDAPVPFTLAELVSFWSLPISVFLFVSFPSGHLGTRFERWFVASTGVAVVLLSVASQLNWDPADNGCAQCPRNLLLVVRNRTLWSVNSTVGDAFLITVLLTVAVLLVRHLRAAGLESLTIDLGDADIVRVLLQGADDQAEMGVLHDLLQAQRETNLRVRLNEYLRFGLEAGIVYAS